MKKKSDYTQWKDLSAIETKLGTSCEEEAIIIVWEKMLVMGTLHFQTELCAQKYWKKIWKAYFHEHSCAGRHPHTFSFLLCWYFITFFCLPYRSSFLYRKKINVCLWDGVRTSKKREKNEELIFCVNKNEFFLPLLLFSFSFMSLPLQFSTALLSHLSVIFFFVCLCSSLYQKEIIKFIFWSIFHFSEFSQKEAEIVSWKSVSEKKKL